MAQRKLRACAFLTRHRQRRVPLTAEGLSKSYGSLKCSPALISLSTEVPRSLSLASTARERRRSCACYPASRSPTRAASCPVTGSKLGYCAQEHGPWTIDVPSARTWPRPHRRWMTRTCATLLELILFQGDDVDIACPFCPGAKRRDSLLQLVVVSGIASSSRRADKQPGSGFARGDSRSTS